MGGSGPLISSAVLEVHESLFLDIGKGGGCLLVVHQHLYGFDGLPVVATGPDVPSSTCISAVSSQSHVDRPAAFCLSGAYLLTGEGGNR